MLITSGQEALYIAIEMERGAIQTYERALMLLDPDDESQTPLRNQLTQILNDELQHLSEFQSLYEGLDTAVETQLMLSAVASSVLFEGGLMAAVRKGMLKDRESLLAFAADAEQKAAETYRSFADSCQDPKAADMLQKIAAEEDTHLCTLLHYSKN